MIDDEPVTLTLTVTAVRVAVKALRRLSESQTSGWLRSNTTPFFLRLISNELENTLIDQQPNEGVTVSLNRVEYDRAHECLIAACQEAEAERSPDALVLRSLLAKFEEQALRRRACRRATSRSRRRTC